MSVHGPPREAVGRRSGHGSLALVAVFVAVTSLIGGRVAASLAIETASAASSGSFTAGTWSVTMYLHNLPTPPVADTPAQFGLAVDSAPPTATALWNYDTDCGGTKPGRLLSKAGSGAAESRTCYYANWRTAAFTDSRTLSGNATLDLWSALRNFQGNKPGAVEAFLMDYDPGTGASTAFANKTISSSNWQNGANSWVEKVATIAIAPSRTIAVGHSLELKLIATSASFADMWIAYDTSAYPSSLTLP